MVDYYEPSHPTPQEIYLLIEVSESSLEYDRYTTIPLYAQSGIPEVWLVNTVAEIVEIYRQPGPDGYGEQLMAAIDTQVSPMAFPDLDLSVAAIFGRSL